MRRSPHALRGLLGLLVLALPLGVTAAACDAFDATEAAPPPSAAGDGGAGDGGAGDGGEAAAPDPAEGGGATYGAALSEAECAKRLLAGRCDVAGSENDVGATDAWRTIVAVDGVATHLDFYVEVTDAPANVFAGVYSDQPDDGGFSPDELLGAGQARVVSTGWISVPLTPPVTVQKDQHVWLAIRGTLGVRVETAACNSADQVWDYTLPTEPESPLPVQFAVSERMMNCNVSARLLP